MIDKLTIHFGRLYRPRADRLQYANDLRGTGRPVVRSLAWPAAICWVRLGHPTGRVCGVYVRLGSQGWYASVLPGRQR